MRRTLTLSALLIHGFGCAAPTPSSAPAGRPTSTASAPSKALASPEGWRSQIPAPPVDAHGMVSTDARLATEVGAQTLAAGGNAVDAAVAVSFALAVVFPSAGNVGGGGFMMYRRPDGEAWALDFRETAPMAASRDMYIDRETGMPTDESVTGALAAGVPGSVAGLWVAHQRFGVLPWKKVVGFAIRLANDGFTVDSYLAESLTRQQKRIARFPSTRALFYPGGQPLAEGETFRNPDLGAVLERIAERGPKGFYEGPTADAIVAEMKRSGGIMTHADLRGYEAKFREPMRVAYRGHELIGMPPPASGALIVALMARVLEPIDVKGLGFHSAAHIHLVAEAMRHAFARRNRYVGDPDFVDVPVDRFNTDAAAKEVRAAFDAQRATPSDDVPSQGSGSDGPHTTHLSVVDAAGGAVALTTTINTSYGSGVVVKGGGFLLNNEMDDFAAAPGRPNAYGLVQGEANAVAAGKRPLSSMTPMIVVDKDGHVRAVSGAAGGPTITTAVFQILSNILDFDMDVAAAVAAPRFHHQHRPDTLFLEAETVGPKVQEELQAMGHTIGRFPFPLGDAPSIAWEKSRWVGGVEVRQDGAAAAGPEPSL